MTSHYNRAHRVAAFTLIEVMVALTIVALSLSAVLASVSQQVQAATAIQERTYANWVGQNQIAAIRLSNETAEVSETDDEAQLAGLEWTLRTTISETGVENLFRVDVEVSLAGREDVIRTVTGFVGEPGIPGQANQAWTSATQAAGEEQ